MTAGGKPSRVYGNRLRRILIPEGFDPAEHLSDGMKKHAPRVLALAHLLSVGDRKPADPNWYVPVHSDDLKKLFGRLETWYPIRQVLTVGGVIESDGTWRQNERPIGYRWGPDFRRRHRVGADLADRRAVDRLEAVSPRIRGGTPGPVHIHLLDWLERTSFDVDAARCLLNRLRGDNRRRARNSIRWITERVHHPKIGKTGRFFTAVTSMERRLRPYLRIGGEPLVSADVSSCQPIALGLIAKWGEKFMQAIAEAGTGPTGHPEAGNTMIRSFADWKHGSDVSGYLAACEAGTLYEEFGKALGLPCVEVRERKRLKKICWFLIMGNPARRSEVGWDRWDTFSRLWPTPAAVLDRLKADCHKNAAGVLQRAEASLMLGSAVGWLMEHHPDVPVLTVHDALMTTPAHANVVREAILRAWEPWGVRPHLK